MAAYRVMSYCIAGAQTPSESRIDHFIEVITSAQPDLVMLQGLVAEDAEGLLKELAQACGLQLHRAVGTPECAFLSRRPLHHLQLIPLGFGRSCTRADLDQGDERIHLFNLTLSLNPFQRLQQVTRLLSDQILHNNALPCAAIICGDFGLPFWGCGKVAFNPHIVRVSNPLMGANYPSSFPFWGRGRIYLQGPIRALSSTVIRTESARKASSHLPLLTTVETVDTRRTIRIDDRSLVRHNQADPVCG